MVKEGKIREETAQGQMGGNIMWSVRVKGDRYPIPSMEHICSSASSFPGGCVCSLVPDLSSTPFRFLMSL